MGSYFAYCKKEREIEEKKEKHVVTNDFLSWESSCDLTEWNLIAVECYFGIGAEHDPRELSSIS